MHLLLQLLRSLAQGRNLGLPNQPRDVPRVDWRIRFLLRSLSCHISEFSASRVNATSVNRLSSRPRWSAPSPPPVSTPLERLRFIYWVTAAGGGAKGDTIHGRQVAAPQQSSDGLAAAHLFDHEKAESR